MSFLFACGLSRNVCELVLLIVVANMCQAYYVGVPGYQRDNEKEVRVTSAGNT